MATLQHRNWLSQIHSNIPILWKTHLTIDTTSGSNVFVKTDGQPMVANNALIGFLGTPMNELLIVSGGTATASGFTTTTLRNSYDSGTPINLTNFDRYAIYSGQSATGTFTIVASGSLSGLNSPDGLPFSGFTADNSAYYKTAYGWSGGYQSTDDLEAFKLNTLGEVEGYCTIDDVLIEAGLYETEYAIQNNKIIQRYIDTAESMIDSVLSNKNVTVPLSSPIPAFIRMTAQQIAAGYLLLKEYGAEAQGSTKDGMMKLNLANTTIKMIQDDLISLPSAGGSNASGNTGQIRFYPNASVESVFTRTKQF